MSFASSMSVSVWLVKLWGLANMSNMSKISNLVIPISVISSGRLFFFLFRCCFSSSNYFFNFKRLSSGMKHFQSFT